MKIVSRNLLVLVVLGFIIPQISFAVWWKPVSWFKKTKTPTVERVENTLATSTAVAVASSTPKAVTESKKQKEMVPQPKKQLPASTISPVEIPKQEVPKQEAQKTETKNKVISLPSGAVVELDARGDVVRTIKEAPAKTANDIVSDLSSQIDILKKQNEEAARQRTAQQQLLEAQQKTLEQIKQNITPTPPPTPVVPEPPKPTILEVFNRNDLQINKVSETVITGGGCGAQVFYARLLDQRENIIKNGQITFTTPDGSITKEISTKSLGVSYGAVFYYNPTRMKSEGVITVSSGELSISGKIEIRDGDNGNACPSDGKPIMY